MSFDVVVSLAGRDAKKCFLIIDRVDEQYVLISDGRHHLVQKPKKKKLKHLSKIAEVAFEGARGELTNRIIRGLLASVRVNSGEE